MTVVANQQAWEDHGPFPESKGMGRVLRPERWPVGSGSLQMPRGGVKHSDGKNWKPEG